MEMLIIRKKNVLFDLYAIIYLKKINSVNISLFIHLYGNRLPIFIELANKFVRFLLRGKFILIYSFFSTLSCNSNAYLKGYVSHNLSVNFGSTNISIVYAA